jgi:hypothetical protein
VLSKEENNKGQLLQQITSISALMLNYLIIGKQQHYGNRLQLSIYHHAQARY